jgi:translation initiation factor IF-3
MRTAEGMRIAREAGLDLVEVSPGATPPVCRIMDFGKYKYEEQQKQKKAKKHQSNVNLKEIKFHVNTEEHDYQVKVNHIRRFLEKGHKVKASLRFRGRENEHCDLGFELINRVGKDCSDVGNPDSKPRLLGNLLILMISTDSKK